MIDIARCRSCQRPIWWGIVRGRRTPMDYDLVTNQPTETSHLATCPAVHEWVRTRSSAVRETTEAESVPWWFR